MAKYSTGGGGASAGGSCELCGADGGDLQTADVAGATLQVCSDCAKNHGENDRTTSSNDGSRDETDRRRRAAQNTARLQDSQTSDASHWEGGADYDTDQLPYLISDYGSTVTEARQEKGLQTSELADELDLDESDVLAVEQGRATQAGVGGSTIAVLEEFLDVDLVDER
ncbi:multiprotein-bridging factor 1 family protein [Halomicroarcula sp. S1AR25-4]|uniref:helix-turn-helix domain-containing protein n=1 Tax=Haloarcula sp. S1AR25-4 TaxID=2950538 RepID=UPI0028748C73|nr:multiprotein-bridging factor 1 family protein [Halomicroarcula sp. S1AR25-4]MDS0276601.1 multiprotein-bridging factor 1 family protein [Halomicroarcula sp. S1AR25-4]